MSNLKDKLNQTFDAHKQADAATAQVMREHHEKEKREKEAFKALVNTVIVPAADDARDVVTARGGQVQFRAEAGDLGEPFAVMQFGSTVRLIFRRGPEGLTAEVVNQRGGTSNKFQGAADRTFVDEMIVQAVGIAYPS